MVTKTFGIKFYLEAESKNSDSVYLSRPVWQTIFLVYFTSTICLAKYDVLDSVLACISGLCTAAVEWQELHKQCTHRQNWLPFMWLAILLIVSPCSDCNPQWWTPHGACSYKKKTQCCSFEPFSTYLPASEVERRCTTTQNLWSTQHQPSFQQIMHDCVCTEASVSAGLQSS